MIFTYLHRISTFELYFLVFKKGMAYCKPLPIFTPHVGDILIYFNCTIKLPSQTTYLQASSPSS